MSIDEKVLAALNLLKNCGELPAFYSQLPKGEGPAEPTCTVFLPDISHVYIHKSNGEWVAKIQLPSGTQGLRFKSKDDALVFHKAWMHAKLVYR